MTDTISTQVQKKQRNNSKQYNLILVLDSDPDGKQLASTLSGISQACCLEFNWKNN